MGGQAMEMLSLPMFLLPSCPPSRRNFPPVPNFPQVFPFHQIITIDHDLHLHLCGFTRLPKILIVNSFPLQRLFLT